MRIDPHVHCRDGKQAYKETIAHVFEIADSQGVKVVFDMPNTDPPVIDESSLKERLKLVPKDRKPYYFLYLGLTGDPVQVAHAVKCWKRFGEVVGLKLFAGRSVGPLAVIEREKQRAVYKQLARLNYRGVVAVHCERERDLIPGLWNPSNPLTHSFARPRDAETNSVRDQISFAKEEGFMGNLHICHATSAETVSLVREAKKEMRITCGVTPHHLTLSFTIQDIGILGHLFKVNPPLRDESTREALVECVKRREVDWIETDHAPHALSEKLAPPHSSGIPSLYNYRHIVEDFLPSCGLSEELIADITFGNIVRTFGKKISHFA